MRGALACPTTKLAAAPGCETGSQRCKPVPGGTNLLDCVSAGGRYGGAAPRGSGPGGTGAVSPGGAAHGPRPARAGRRPCGGAARAPARGDVALRAGTLRGVLLPCDIGHRGPAGRGGGFGRWRGLGRRGGLRGVVGGLGRRHRGCGRIGSGPPGTLRAVRLVIPLAVHTAILPSSTVSYPAAGVAGAGWATVSPCRPSPSTTRSSRTSSPRCGTSARTPHLPPPRRRAGHPARLRGHPRRPGRRRHRADPARVGPRRPAREPEAARRADPARPASGCWTG